MGQFTIPLEWCAFTEQVSGKNWSTKGMKLSFNIFISREIFWTSNIDAQRANRWQEDWLAPFSGKYDDKKQIPAVP